MREVHISTLKLRPSLIYNPHFQNRLEHNLILSKPFTLHPWGKSGWYCVTWHVDREIFVLSKHCLIKSALTFACLHTTRWWGVSAAHCPASSLGAVPGRQQQQGRQADVVATPSSNATPPFYALISPEVVARGASTPVLFATSHYLQETSEHGRDNLANAHAKDPLVRRHRRPRPLSTADAHAKLPS